MKPIEYLRLRLMVARVCVAVMAVSGAIAAYPTHRSFVSLIGGIFLAYVVAWFGGVVQRAKCEIEKEKANG